MQKDLGKLLEEGKKNDALKRNEKWKRIGDVPFCETNKKKKERGRKIQTGYQ